MEWENIGIDPVARRLRQVDMRDTSDLDMGDTVSCARAPRHSQSSLSSLTDSTHAHTASAPSHRRHAHRTILLSSGAA